MVRKRGTVFERMFYFCNPIDFKLTLIFPILILNSLMPTPAFSGSKLCCDL